MMLQNRLFITCLALSVWTFVTGAATNTQFQEFIENIERLVMHTFDRALMVTKNVYLELNQTMPEALRNSTQNQMLHYVQQVDEALRKNATYAEKRKLLRQFRVNNQQIEQQRKKLDPQQSSGKEYQFELISEDFYNEARNRTEFDNLYLEFMREFELQSQVLWRNLAEETVEEKEDFLEILDEISKEQLLREKDKLYDEFIEMFLFKEKRDNIEIRDSEIN